MSSKRIVWVCSTPRCAAEESAYNGKPPNKPCRQCGSLVFTKVKS